MPEPAPNLFLLNSTDFSRGNAHTISVMVDLIYIFKKFFFTYKGRELSTYRTVLLQNYP